MMYMKAVLLFVLYSAVRSAPVEEHGCDVDLFKANILYTSLLPENEIVCPTNGGKLKANQLCQHLYKCPLDITSKVRHCEAVCRENGTWDYQYPSCSDMLPLAEYLQAQVLLDELDKQEEEIPTKNFRSADSIINELQENHNNPIDIEDFTKPKPETYTEKSRPEGGLLSRVRRWSFYKPPPRKLPPTTTTQKPTTTAPITTTDSHNDTDYSWVERYCGPRLCSIANTMGCHVLTLLKMHPDYALQTSLCRICMLMNYCPTSVGMFGTSV